MRRKGRNGMGRNELRKKEIVVKRTGKEEERNKEDAGKCPPPNFSLCISWEAQVGVPWGEGT